MTRGFASPPHDGFALIAGLFRVNGGTSLLLFLFRYVNQVSVFGEARAGTVGPNEVGASTGSEQKYETQQAAACR
jgi:hypothetical protein